VEESDEAAVAAHWPALPPAAARVLMGLATHPDAMLITSAAVSTLAGRDTDSAAVRTTLLDSGTLTLAAEMATDAPLQWLRMPAPVRRTATARLAELDLGEQIALLRIVCDTYWVLAHHTDTLLTPYRTPPAYTPVVKHASPFTNADQVWTWLGRAGSVIVALARSAQRRGLHETAWQLCDVLWLFLQRQGDQTLRLQADTVGLEAAYAWGHRTAIAEFHKRLGRALLKTQDWENAQHHITTSVDLYRQADDHLGIADAREAQAALALARGRHEQAKAEFTNVLGRYRELGVPRKVALTTLNIADTCLRDGDLDAATQTITESIALYSTLEPQDPYNAARAVQLLGRIRAARGDHEKAWTLLTQALAMLSAAGGLKEVVATHRDLAELARACAWRERELTHLQQLHEHSTVHDTAAAHAIALRIAALTESPGPTP
jgi:tetratricopeptide (TPR) repeat protein